MSVLGPLISLAVLVGALAWARAAIASGVPRRQRR
jgi:hypothetical protein